MAKKPIESTGKPTKITVATDAYFSITVIMPDKFTYKIASRGYRLKSWLDFERKISPTSSVTYKEITETQYSLLMFGPAEPKPKKTKQATLEPQIPITTLVIDPKVKKTVVKKKSAE